MLVIIAKKFTNRFVNYVLHQSIRSVTNKDIRKMSLSWIRKNINCECFISLFDSHMICWNGNWCLPWTTCNNAVMRFFVTAAFDCYWIYALLNRKSAMLRKRRSILVELPNSQGTMLIEHKLMFNVIKCLQNRKFIIFNCI